MSLLALSGTNSVSGGYEIDNSVKMEADNTEYLSRVLSSTGNRRTFTISTWRKRTELGDMQTMYACNVSGQEGTLLRFATENASYPDAIQIDIGAVSTNSRSYTSASFRDTSAWYHVVLAVDTTQSTATDRFKLYVNGVLITDYASRNNPAQNFDTSNNHADNSNTQHVGAYTTGGQVYGKTSGYTADTYHIDGQALAPTEFGEFDDDTGIWKPKAYTGSYGTNGFFLDFADASDLGDDESGNGNDFTETNITAADQSVDSPTNNFCTLNILYNYAYGNTITEGATKIYGAANNWGGGKATFGLTSGKWYWEIKQLANGNTFMGLQTDGEDNISSGNAQSQNTSVVFYTDGTLQYSNGSETTTSAANSIVANSIVGFALDLDSSTQTIKVYLDGSLITAFGSSGTANLSTYNLADKTVFPFVALYDRTVNINFGGYTVSSISSAASDANGYGTFEHAPPSGYYSICSQNLAEFG
jgi:hypothetical protein